MNKQMRLFYGWRRNRSYIHLNNQSHLKNLLPRNGESVIIAYVNVWKKCDCECSKHPHWKCPNKPPKETQDRAAGSSTSSSVNLNNLSADISGQINKIPNAKSKTNDRDVVKVSHSLDSLDNNLHIVNLGMEVVEQDIIMLIGANRS